MSPAFITGYIELDLASRVAHFIKYMQFCGDSTFGRSYYIPLSPMIAVYKQAFPEDSGTQVEFERVWSDTEKTVLGYILFPPERLRLYIELATFLNTIKDEFYSSLICHKCLIQSGYVDLTQSEWKGFGISGTCNICEKDNRLVTHPEAFIKIKELSLDKFINPIELSILHNQVHRFTDMLGLFNKV